MWITCKQATVSVFKHLVHERRALFPSYASYAYYERFMFLVWILFLSFCNFAALFLCLNDRLQRLISSLAFWFEILHLSIWCCPPFLLLCRDNKVFHYLVITLWLIHLTFYVTVSENISWRSCALSCLTFFVRLFLLLMILNIWPGPSRNSRLCFTLQKNKL